MKFACLGLFVATLVLQALPASAQGVQPAPEIAALLTALRTDKREAVAKSLDLSEAEAKKFWPLYDEFQRRLDATHRQRNRLVAEVVGTGKAVSDLYAKRLATELLTIEEAEVAAERRMQRQVLKVLPALKATRYMQIENKARAVRAYDIAVTIPLLK